MLFLKTILNFTIIVIPFIIIICIVINSIMINIIIYGMRKYYTKHYINFNKFLKFNFSLKSILLLSRIYTKSKSVKFGLRPQLFLRPGRVAQSVGHLTRKSGVLGSIAGLATYFRFSFRFFKKGSCQLLAKVCARSTG